MPLLAQPGLLTAVFTDPELGPLVRAPATMRLLMADPVLAPLLATATNNTTATTATAAQPERGRLIVSPSRGHQGNEDRPHAAGLNAHEELIALASHHPSAVGGGDAVVGAAGSTQGQQCASNRLLEQILDEAMDTTAAAGGHAAYLPAVPGSGSSAAVVSMRTQPVGTTGVQIEFDVD